jgi:hypothetical protein
LVKLQFEQHVARQIQIGPSLQKDASQPDGGTGSPSIDGSLSAADAGTEDGPLQASLSDDHQIAAITSLPFQFRISILRLLDLSETGSDKTNLQRQHRAVSEPDIVKPQGDLGSARYSARAANLGDRRPDFASTRNGHVASSEDIV